MDLCQICTVEKKDCVIALRPCRNMHHMCKEDTRRKKVMPILQRGNYLYPAYLFVGQYRQTDLPVLNFDS